MYLLRYLTFEEYQKLGGKCTEDTFLTLQYDSESKMNFLTFGNVERLIDKLGNVPEDIKNLEVKLIDIVNSVNTDRDTSITSYSNGIETFSFSTEKSAQQAILQNFKDLMMQYLWKYPELFYRGRWVERARFNNPSQ